MKRTSILTAILLLLSLAPIVSADVAPWSNATASGAAEATLRGLIVREHERVCANTLTNNAALVTLARYRSTEMALEGWFSHKNPRTGQNVFPLMGVAKIPFRSAGENIAKVYSAVDLATTASAAYRQFMGSAGHRDLIRACSYSRVGVGTYRIGYTHWFTVLFVQP